MGRLDSGLASGQEKVLQACVPERLDHASTVARSASRVKDGRSGFDLSAAMPHSTVQD
jgi:hypothetical protein